MARHEVALVFWLCALGCGGSNGGGGAEPAQAPVAAAPTPPAAPVPVAAAPAPVAAAPTPAPQPAAAAATDRIDDPSFELKAAPVGSYATGQLGSFALSLTPHGEYHVNQEYPISISLQGDEGLSFPKSQLAKADAAKFGEKLARFDVPFTPAKAGDHRVEAKVRFAVCTKENCVPDERTLALMLPVK